MKNFGGFDHNEQTIRVLTHLEKRYAGFDGLNLSWETIEGVAKHNGPTGKEKRHHIALLDRCFDLDLDNHASAEAQLANLADDIAYLSHDFDDGLRAGLFKLDDICQLPQVSEALEDISQRYGHLDLGRTTHELVRRLISVFVEDLLNESRKNFEILNPLDVDDIRKAGKPIIAFSKKMAMDLQCLKDYLFENMWRHFKVNRMTSKAKRVVTDLFDLFMSEPNTLPNDWQFKDEKFLIDLSESERARIIADYIASMTDRYAIIEHQRLFDMGPIFK